jgi:hypothetical protein
LKPDAFADLIDDEFVGKAIPEDQRLFLERVKANKCQPHRGCEFQYDYPYMVRTRNGDLHLLYTWNKTAIRHAWLKADAVESRATPQQPEQGAR